MAALAQRVFQRTTARRPAGVAVFAFMQCGCTTAFDAPTTIASSAHIPEAPAPGHLEGVVLRRLNGTSSTTNPIRRTLAAASPAAAPGREGRAWQPPAVRQRHRPPQVVGWHEHLQPVAGAHAAHLGGPGGKGQR